VGCTALYAPTGRKDFSRAILFRDSSANSDNLHFHHRRSASRAADPPVLIARAFRVAFSRGVPISISSSRSRTLARSIMAGEHVLHMFCDGLNGSCVGPLAVICNGEAFAGTVLTMTACAVSPRRHALSMNNGKSIA
jgi:hypothetical protein